MTSRTPIRLTPHRGPLATPSTSPESSPTLSTPPIDFSYCSTKPTLDIAIIQHQISALTLSTQCQYVSPLHRRRHEVRARQGLFGCSTHLSQLGLVFESLIYSINELAKTLPGIVTFCLFIWGLLEWSSYASELPRQPSSWISMSRLPLPPPTRALLCHTNFSLCEPRDQHVAVLQFLSEQIQHAKALSSLTVGLGLPLRAFLESHRATVSNIVVSHDNAELPTVQKVDTLANLTESLDHSLLDFTSGSFIGRSFFLALEELGDLISESVALHGSSTEHQDIHLHAIYWRTTSNLLLEYSAARLRVRRLSQHVHALHQQLSPLVLGHRATRSVEGRLNNRWWKGIVRHPTTSIEDGIQSFVTGLEVTLDNIHRLIAYLDWITEQLARTSLKDILKTRRRADFSSCMISLQELFAQSKSLTSKKLRRFCLNDYGIMLLTPPERVEVMVPGSPTVHAER